MKSVLITGGSGALGQQLTSFLLNKGYTVSHLSRSPGKDPKVKTYQWDVNNGVIDEACIDGVDTIIHLAGAGIADERWTDKRKKVLIESRTKSIALLYNLLKRKPHKVKSVISASGIGYYSDREDKLMYESNAPNTDFLAQCCIEWEAAVDEGHQLGLRIVKFRTGVVLDKKEGALPQLSLPVKFGFGAALGSGKQWISWIHWHDVAAMYLFAIENNIQGTFNMVAPHPVTNKQLTKAVAKVLKRPFWMPNVPGFALKTFLGEMATLVLGSTKVSAQKIQEAGYKFKFVNLNEALQDIYAK
ncbi:TIGR01777 family protein [Mucilaginibacter limnophilus]|uniref:TIGR01777 family protein n=1 Tax=Mucilaginibacter limnophilus TaxID=1932778 RepID=A0A437MVF3_9SPHI|nr:TIGR01777 family oxidoreductase [Mucilaginibacter limnophilus]RVU01607.1 TIGR01777 family protein [Mucilaginibacter limnophilus]